MHQSVSSQHTCMIGYSILHSVTFLSVVVFTDLTDGIYCDNGWVNRPGSDSCYKFVLHAPTTWDRAEGLCRDERAHVATLETEQEIVWMHGYRSYHKNLQEFLWLGAYKKGNRWYWRGDVADSPMLASDWAVGEPNNSNGNQECAILIDNTTDGRRLRFDDVSCNAKFAFVCERN